MANIPIVDLGENGDGSKIKEELDVAFSTIGFVYLKNHGVDQYLVDEVYKTSRTFFQLPDDVKESYRINSERSDGWTAIDQEMLDVSSLHEVRESYEVSSFKGLYPDEDAPEFHQAVDRLVPQLVDLTIRLLKYMALALGLEEDFFSSRHQLMFQGDDKNRTIFRSLHYPSLTDSDIQPGVVRCGAHSDYGSITLLFQDDAGGLEVLSRGEWVSATPIPNTILVNLGDLMQFWTSDRYVATVHRVRVPEEEIRRKTPRQSIAFFVNADNGVMINPLDGSDKHPPVEALEYLNSRLNATYK